MSPYTGTFYRFWVEEKGHPPSTPQERALFKILSKCWRRSRQPRSYKEIRSDIEQSNPDAVFFEDPDFSTALVGMTTDYRAVYDYELCITHLIDQMPADEGNQEQQAIDFFSYNVLQPLDTLGDITNRPVVIYGSGLQPYRK